MQVVGSLLAALTLQVLSTSGIVMPLALTLKWAECTGLYLVLS